MKTTPCLLRSLPYRKLKIMCFLFMQIVPQTQMASVDTFIRRHGKSLAKMCIRQWWLSSIELFSLNSSLIRALLWFLKWTTHNSFLTWDLLASAIFPAKLSPKSLMLCLPQYCLGLYLGTKMILWRAEPLLKICFLLRKVSMILENLAQEVMWS